MYGQLRRDPEVVTYPALRGLLDQLAEQGYETSVVAHLWIPADGEDFDTTHAGRVRLPDSALETFTTLFRPVSMHVERARAFGAQGFTSNTLSQMCSRTRARDLLVQLLSSLCLNPASVDLSPVFFCRADFGVPVAAKELVQQFEEQPHVMYLAAGYPFNDNFLLLRTPAFCEFFESLYPKCLQYPDCDQPLFHTGWVPESILFQRFKELQPLELVRSQYIPDFR